MHNLYIKWDLDIDDNLEIGYVTMVDRGGNFHRNKALNVPGYGFVPCSRKLRENFTTDPEHLVLVISDANDDNPSYTSNIWVSRTEIKKTKAVSIWG